LHWVDECGHVPMQEQPDIFNSLFLDFLKRTVDIARKASA